MTDTLHQTAIVQIIQILRVSTLSDPTHAEARRALDQSAVALASVLDAGNAPRLSVVFSEAMVFLNGQDLRVERPLYEEALELGRHISRMGVNEIVLEAGLRAGDLRSLVEHLVWAMRRGTHEQEEVRPSPRILLRHTDASLLIGLEDEQLEPSEQVARTCASALIVMERVHEGLLKGDTSLLRHIHHVARSLVTLSKEHGAWLLGFIARAPNRGDAAMLSVKSAILSVLTMRHITDATRVLVDVALTALLHDTGALRAMRLWNHARRHGFEVMPRMNEDAADRLPEATATAIAMHGQLHEAALARAVYAHEEHMLLRRVTRGMPHEGRMAPTLEALTLSTVRAYLEAVSQSASTTAPLPPDEAAAQLLASASGPTEGHIAALFLHTLGLHRPGTPVRLSSGWGAVVLANGTRPLTFPRPRVLLVLNERGIPLGQPREQDLNEQSQDALRLGHIVEVLDHPHPRIGEVSAQVASGQYRPVREEPVVLDMANVQMEPFVDTPSFVELDLDEIEPVMELDASEIEPVHPDTPVAQQAPPPDASRVPGVTGSGSIGRIKPVRRVINRGSKGAAVEGTRREFGENSRFGGIVGGGRREGREERGQRGRRGRREPVGPDSIRRTSPELDARQSSEQDAAPRPPEPQPTSQPQQPEPQPAQPATAAQPPEQQPHNEPPQAPHAPALRMTFDDIPDADAAQSLGFQVVNMDDFQHLLPQTFSRFGFEEDEAARKEREEAPVSAPRHLMVGAADEPGGDGDDDDLTSRSGSMDSGSMDSSIGGRLQIITKLDESGSTPVHGDGPHKVSVAAILQEAAQYAEEDAREEIEHTLDDRNAISRDEMFRMLGIEGQQTGQHQAVPPTQDASPEPRNDARPAQVDMTQEELPIAASPDTPPHTDAPVDTTSEYSASQLVQLIQQEQQPTRPPIALEPPEDTIDYTREHSAVEMRELLQSALPAGTKRPDDEQTEEYSADQLASLGHPAAAPSHEPDPGEDATGEYSRDMLLELARAAQAPTPASAKPAPAPTPPPAAPGFEDDATGEYSMSMLVGLTRAAQHPPAPVEEVDVDGPASFLDERNARDMLANPSLAAGLEEDTAPPDEDEETHEEVVPAALIEATRQEPEVMMSAGVGGLTSSSVVIGEEEADDDAATSVLNVQDLPHQLILGGDASGLDEDTSPSQDSGRDAGSFITVMPDTDGAGAYDAPGDDEDDDESATMVLSGDMIPHFLQAPSFDDDAPAEGHDPFAEEDNGPTIVLAPEVLEELSVADAESEVSEASDEVHTSAPVMTSRPVIPRQSPSPTLDEPTSDPEDDDEDDDAPTAMLSSDVLDYIQQLDRRD